MNSFFRDEEKRQQDRKYQDLEFRFHEMERERDKYLRERNEIREHLQSKIRDFTYYKESVDQKVEEFRESLLYLPSP